MSLENNQNRTVSAELLIGILWIPLIFSWFTLRKGHSTEARVSAFGWLICKTIYSFAMSSIAFINIDNGFVEQHISKEVQAQKKQVLESEDIKNSGAGVAYVDSSHFSQDKGVVTIVLGEPEQVWGADRVWDFAERATRIFKTISQNHPEVLDRNVEIVIVSEANLTDNTGKGVIKKMFSMTWRTEDLKKINWDDFDLSSLLALASHYRFYNGTGKQIISNHCHNFENDLHAKRLCQSISKT